MPPEVLRHLALMPPPPPPPLSPPADQASTGKELEALRSQLLDHVLPLIRGYIWQRDRFNLQLSTQRQAPWQRARSSGARRRDAAAAADAIGSMPPHLWGSVSFGDNIEDEWLVVWLLLELTRAFPVTARCAGRLVLLCRGLAHQPDKLAS